MGFPEWTLWGMALSATGTLIMLSLAFVAQSPRLISRLGLKGQRLDLRARGFTGYALALLLLSFGFFLAGVPIGTPAATELASATGVPVPTTNPIAVVPTEPSDLEASSAPAAVEGDVQPESTREPSTGAFPGALPPSEGDQPSPPAEEIVAEDDGQPAATSTATPTASNTPTPSPVPTTTPTPTATSTPLPTFTPTPIFEETGLVNTGTSTLWLKRTPGGQDFILVRGGDTVILRPGHSNQGGVLWRQVQTVDGEIGWLRESFLATEEAVQNTSPSTNG